MKSVNALIRHQQIAIKWWIMATESDGKTIDPEAINKAIEVVSQSGGGVVPELGSFTDNRKLFNLPNDEIMHNLEIQ